MHAMRDFNLSDDLRVLGIFDIDDACPVRRVHVSDEGVAVFDYNLSAACHIRAFDLPHVFTDFNWGALLFLWLIGSFSSSS
jgi:hypothetical protein